MHYKYIEATYSNVKFLFKDIDSLGYEIKTDDVYKDFYKKIRNFLILSIKM